MSPVPNKGPRANPRASSHPERWAATTATVHIPALRLVLLFVVTLTLLLLPSDLVTSVGATSARASAQHASLREYASFPVATDGRKNGAKQSRPRLGGPKVSYIVINYLMPKTQHCGEEDFRDKPRCLLPPLVT